ncbi:putative exonuclease GOR [Daphnia carinata]|uniref:putative exonuclease GOR n=1 Tax=Daphnia carinata TaxID=120202 RepID=UPI00258043CE|nr:putative exonuclease GOR [Daphnia carinata]
MPLPNIDPNLLKGPAFYKVMQRHVISPRKQELNGYPRPHPYCKNRVVINATNLNSFRPKSAVSLALYERICDRCNTRYNVNSTGSPLGEQGVCCYHWGRSFRNPQTKTSNPFTCCGQNSEAKGCTTAKWHISNIENITNLEDYVQTKEKPPPTDDDYGIYALDCEMCYTTEGSDLICITVVSSDCKIAYKTLVKPSNPVLDYNTRFSGITEDDLRDVTTTLEDVQTFLLNLFSSKTILIGHDFGADLRALKMVHDTVVDTSIVFPHARGPPLKRGLKKLVFDILEKTIQNEGHNSTEDAIACMELMIWKVKHFLG